MPESSPAPHSGPHPWWVEPRTWRIAGRVALGLIILVVLALVSASIAGVVLVRRAFPQTEGTVALPGLAAEVTVIRDANGIPNLYADTSEDLFFAQGYVQAQDRFFEMDIRRHTTAGRLAELLGPDAVETDMFIRTLGWRRVAEQELSLLSADTLRYLQAYSRGVNAYINEHSLSEMSLEYSLLGITGLDYTVEQWTPVDSIAWLKAMAWDLRGNMEEEIDRATASAHVTPAQLAELYPDYPYERHRPILESGDVIDGAFSARAATGGSFSARALDRLDVVRRLSASLPDMVGSGNGVGSNSWVVDGEHSVTGKPLLANDPHLGLSIPGIWYQMGLHCNEISSECPFDVSGFTFSGLPGVVIGHNASIAWGFTNLGPDVVDLYLEKVKNQTYRYAGKWHDLALRDETIKVAGEKEVVFTVRSTEHGPLLSDVSTSISTAGANAEVTKGSPRRGNGYAVSIQWTALIPNNTADAIFELDQAQDWTSFRAAAEDFAVPSQNMVYADIEGNIGYQAPGMIPVRQAGNDGWMPNEGWDPSNDWSGRFIPFEELPSALNPDEGFFATANQAVIGSAYAHPITTDWDMGYRSQRIYDLLGEQDKFSIEDFTTLQTDDLNNFAETLTPYLLEQDMDAGRYYSAGQRLLKDWDFRQPADSAAAAYFNAVWSHLLALTFHDELPESLWPDGGGRWFEVVRPLLEDPRADWWDDVTTEDLRESRNDILKAALTDARDELTHLQARRAGDWTWGHQHLLNLENQTLGQSDIGLVRWLLNRGGYEVGGGESTVNATGWTSSMGYEIDWAPSMRMVVSLADFDDSRWINLTGVSGHAFHANYVDQTELWADGRTLPWAFGLEAVDAAAEHTLTLVPAP